jgi:hypothetical protein
MKYRDKPAGQLLDGVSAAGSIKTKLMYQAYLSFNQLRENFALSDENGLLEYAIDNDMIEYQRRVYNNSEYRSESLESPGLETGTCE